MIDTYPVIFGWDISTSIIGVTTLTDSGSFVESAFLDLRKCDKGLIDKTHEAECLIGLYARSWGQWDNVHYVEDRLGNFSKGLTSLQTLMTLAAFNSSVSYVIWREFNACEGKTSVVHLHLMTIKSMMKKQGLVIPKGANKKALTLEWVSLREPDFPVTLNKNGNPQPYCFDMADSYVVAKAGYLKGCSKLEK